jgi:hypothetical protein
MRKIGLGLALVASSQLMLLSSPAVADDSKSASAEPSPAAPEPNSSSSSKATTGWIVLGAGGALTLGGLVLDIVAAGKNHLSGQGGPGDTSTTQNQKTDLLFAGTTMIVAGIVAGIYGGSLVVASSKHTAEADPSREPQPAAGSADAVTKTAQASLASSPSFLVPVVGARF